MSDLNKLKKLRNALSCWQDDYDPTEDKEQFDMFGDAVDAVGRLEAAEALAEFRGKHVSSLDKLIADRDKRIAELTAVVDQRNAECDRLIIEKGLLRIKAAPGKPVAHFILVDGEYNQLASQFAESPDAIPLYAAPPAPSATDGWIKCSDRMPECGKWDHAAVMASEGRNSFVAYYNKHDCKFLDEPFGDSLGNKITHWQPLPAAPGGD